MNVLCLCVKCLFLFGKYNKSIKYEFILLHFNIIIG